jgi:Domain of unknown function (DUF1906)
MPNYNILPGEKYSLGIDSAYRPGGFAVRNSPYSTIFRYLTDGGTELPDKHLTLDEVESYLVYDVALVSNWESTGTVGDGYNQGIHDANAAIADHINLGGPVGATIYFSIDYDAPESDQPLINLYLQACYDTFGEKFNVGLYAGYWVCKRARDRFPDIRIWQTGAWSGGNILDNIQAYQRVQTATVGGCSCDVNEIRQPLTLGAWQDVKDVNNVVSLVDQKTYTPEQMMAYIDFHTYNTDTKLDTMIAILNHIASKLGA